uniref:Uncharacterized protein n=1 Tax=Tetranychus urticae TaxID=32264 RepID=T1KMP0_TETUR
MTENLTINLKDRAIKRWNHILKKTPTKLDAKEIIIYLTDDEFYK